MTKKLLISEEEKHRILNLHKKAILESNNKEIINEAFSQTVYDVQKKLKPNYGHLLGKSGKNSDGVDGIFGSKTVDALKKYQEDNDMIVTGRMDAETLRNFGIKKSSETKKQEEKSSCIAIDNTFCSKISSNKESPIGDGGGEGCSEYVRKMTGNYLGNAWQAFLNAKSKGSVIYNMFTDGSINWDKIRNSKFVNSSSCACFVEEGEGKDNTCKNGNSISSKISSFYPSKSSVNLSSLKVGDIVGMYYGNSGNKGKAFCERAVIDRSLDGDGKYNDINPFTFNTHVGYVGAIKDGVPIIFHSVHGKRIATPGNQLLNKSGEAMITWVVAMGKKN